MSSKAALLKAIKELVEERKAAGQVVDSSACAIRLSSDYPESGMALHEIARQIEATAVKRRAALLSGSGRPH